MMPGATDRSEMSDEVAKQIHAFIKDDLLMGQGEEFGSDDALLEDGIIDSLGLLDVVTFIETEFDITVEDADVTLDNFGSVNAIASYVGSSKAAT
jgi:acyl carrier protein